MNMKDKEQKQTVLIRDDLMFGDLPCANETLFNLIIRLG